MYSSKDVFNSDWLLMKLAGIDLMKMYGVSYTKDE